AYLVDGHEHVAQGAVQQFHGAGARCRAQAQFVLGLAHAVALSSWVSSVRRLSLPMRGGFGAMALGALCARISRLMPARVARALAPKATKRGRGEVLERGSITAPSSTPSMPAPRRSMARLVYWAPRSLARRSRAAANCRCSTCSGAAVVVSETPAAVAANIRLARIFSGVRRCSGSCSSSISRASISLLSIGVPLGVVPGDLYVGAGQITKVLGHLGQCRPPFLFAVHGEDLTGVLARSAGGVMRHHAGPAGAQAAAGRCRAAGPARGCRRW